MDDVIHYLELKNQYYHKFYSVTEKFLEEQARKNCWDELECLVDIRERILNIIRSFDFKIAELFERETVDETLLRDYQTRVRALLGERTQLAHRIVALDLELIHRIDDVKSDTIKDLKRKIESSSGVALHPKSPHCKIKEV